MGITKPGKMAGRDILGQAGFPAPKITTSRRLPSGPQRRSSHPCSVSRSSLNHLNTVHLAKLFPFPHHHCPSQPLELSLKWRGKQGSLLFLFGFDREPQMSKVQATGTQHPPLIHKTTEAQYWDSLRDLAGTHTAQITPTNPVIQGIPSLFLDTASFPSK